MFTAEELLPIKLTLELALITTVFLLLVATPDRKSTRLNSSH